MYKVIKNGQVVATYSDMGQAHAAVMQIKAQDPAADVSVQVVTLS